MANQEAQTVANLLVHEFISRFGVPLLIHSDQGRNFESAVFAEICKLLDITKTRTTPYHPQCDGMVERFNRTVETLLSSLLMTTRGIGTSISQFSCHNARSAIHKSTGCSPAKLMLGRDLTLPIDLAFGRPTEAPQTAVEYVNTLQERMERVHDFARNHDGPNETKVQVLTWVSAVAAWRCRVVIQPSAEEGSYS